MTAANKQALLIENGQLVADTLRHLANNEIDSDYFAITSTNENGTEIDHELVITDYALQAAGTVDELVKALEAAEKAVIAVCNRSNHWKERAGAAEKRIAELREWNVGLAQESLTYQQRVAELEARTVNLPNAALVKSCT